MPRPGRPKAEVKMILVQTWMPPAEKARLENASDWMKRNGRPDLTESAIQRHALELYLARLERHHGGPFPPRSDEPLPEGARYRPGRRLRPREVMTKRDAVPGG